MVIASHPVIPSWALARGRPSGWSSTRATRCCLPPPPPSPTPGIWETQDRDARGVTSLAERHWDSERMVVWGGAMVCRTRLILEQTGLLLSIPGAVVSALGRGGKKKGGGAQVRSSPDSQAPTSPSPPPLRVKRWPGYRGCTVTAARPRCARVWCRIGGQVKAPPLSTISSPSISTSRPTASPLDGQDTPSTRPRRSWSSTQDHSLHSQPKGPRPPPPFPGTTQQTSLSCTPHAATYKELVPRASHH